MSAVVDFPVKPEARPYLEAFGRDRRRGDPAWLRGYRRRSLARFAELGFPSRRSEAWRYIDLRQLEQRPMLPTARPTPVVTSALATQLAEIGLAEPSYRLVLVDGKFAPELSSLDQLPSTVRLGSIAAAIAERPDLVRSALEAQSPDRPFASLNAAFFAGGFVLDIAPGIALERPVEILHLAAGDAAGALYTRSLVVAGQDSRATVVESFAGSGDYWRNDVIELRLGAGSELTRVTFVAEGVDALHFGETLARLDEASRLSGFVLLAGGRTVRHDVTVRSEGAGSRCDLNGVFLLSGRQEANILTTVDHRAPGGETREVFKGVATGHAHGAFQGRITVRPGAQKVDAHQLSRNLVLSPRAAIDTKPELEIYADDVKCSHGAAIGDLDEAALFYLRARGISNNEARRMLIEAFAQEAVDLIEQAPLREHLRSRLTRRLATLEE
ncbi:MAG: Fe-S cluster assembly protein SufD [Alphaproteobacteria bacterium]|nr:Fe-S cluster assembly protein SufD [Alphaproteobacteria bacterium]MBV9377568.1 Fe-S cluster assembly protein SufD [Alphaproteobacteria bacterium]